jgi:hypothetical protein
MNIDLDEVLKMSQAWNEIMKIARENALILQAAGGIAILAHPKTQMEEGEWCRSQYMTKRGSHPKQLMGENGEEIYYCDCVLGGKGTCYKKYLAMTASQEGVK